MLNILDKIITIEPNNTPSILDIYSAVASIENLPPMSPRNEIKMVIERICDPYVVDKALIGINALHDYGNDFEQELVRVFVNLREEVIGVLNAAGVAFPDTVRIVGFDGYVAVLKVTYAT